jgi:hypothetical protein
MACLILVSEMANQKFPWWLCAACNEKQDSLAVKRPL